MPDRTQQDASFQVRTQDQQDDQPATDGQAIRPIDKALLGGAPQRVGRFDYHYDSDTWTWSEAVALIHGYQPGDVEPTTDLVLSHKHPDDLAQVKGLLQQSEAPFSSRHRIKTASGRIVATQGFYVDITDHEYADLQQSLGEELDTIIPHRAAIEQAKGMLMALYAVDEDAAFSILRWRSQQLNIKLATIAASLVADLPGLVELDPSTRAPVDHYLMSRPPT